MGAMIEEQEICINALRSDKFATVYCSDSTWITKMDKLVAKAPNLFSVVKEDEISKTYKFPKRLLSIRSSIREMSEEQKKSAAERMRSYYAKDRTS